MVTSLDRGELNGPGAGEKDIDPALLPLHRLVEAVEIGEAGGIALDAGDVAADRPDGRGQFVFTSSREEDAGPSVARAIPGGAPVIVPTLPFQLARAFATSGCRQYGTLFTVQKALPLFNVFVDSRNRFLGYRS
jgi:hypothetical protein